MSRQGERCLIAQNLGASTPMTSAGSCHVTTPLSAVVPLWQDRPPHENLDVARLADRFGYDELFIGEMATYDAFALGTAIGAQTSIPLTLGPFAVHVRTPMSVAMGAASVADLIARPDLPARRVSVALGTSSDVVVREWHGRDRDRTARTLAEHAIATRQLLAGEKSNAPGEHASSRGYRLRLGAPPGELTLAAFGPATIKVAAAHADRLLLNMLTPELAATLCEQLAAAARELSVPVPRVAIWLATAVDPSDATIDQILRGKVGYLAAPGYGEMFAQAGFGDLIAFARTRPHPSELLAAMPRELAAAVGLVGTSSEIRRRVADYRAAGVDQICIVPATADDPAGERTLAALAPNLRQPNLSGAQ